MSFKSKAQQRFMFAKAGKGELSKRVVEEFAAKTNFKNLPERVRKSKKK